MVERRRTDSLQTIRNDLVAHARSLTEITNILSRQEKDLDDIKIDRAVRKEIDKGMNERFDRLELGIKGIRGIGMWILAGFGAVLVTALGSFIINGGLVVAH